MKIKIKSLFKILSGILLAMFIFLFSIIIYFDYTLPNSYYANDKSEIKFSSFTISSEQSVGTIPTSYSNDSNFEWVKLMGFIPVKQVMVEEKDSVYVTPSGNPFGIKMFSEGAIVVGLEQISTKDGVKSPWKDSNIRIGDIVVKANNKPISRNDELALIIQSSNGKPVTLELSRGENQEKVKTTLTPVLSDVDESYKTGVWVRDSTAGVGTITYYDDENMTFAGLGHGICDMDTGTIVPVGSGEVCDVLINNITKGKVGLPGELMGVFTTDIPFGSIELNNETGIYGNVFEIPKDENKEYELAYKQEVTTGKATILCCFDGQEKQEYQIEIEKIDYNKNSEIKNLNIKVTDKDLLALTGGIVQGMSGTPIIQNGKLVGAVTHVLVNNPTEGYGIFAENMYNYSSDF